MSQASPYISVFSMQLLSVPSSFIFSMYCFRSSETELTGDENKVRWNNACTYRICNTKKQVSSFR